MYRIGDYLVYRKDVCKVIEINYNYYRDIDYYKLAPINDASLKFDVPVNNKFIRDVLPREKVIEIIEKIPQIDVIENNDRYIENDYKELMARGTPEDLIKIIKTTYSRNKERIDNKKKTTDKDRNYFNLAEKYLYTEFATALNLGYDETKKYVLEYVESLKER